MGKVEPERFFAVELPARLAGRVPPDLACTVQIEAREGGAWWVHLDRGRVTSGPGAAEQPSFTLSAHAADWADLLEGAATLRACLIDGRVEVEGDLALAMRVVPLLLGG